MVTGVQTDDGSSEQSAGRPSPAVRQAFSLIDVIAAAPAPSRLRDLVEATGLAKSTVHRLVGTLVDIDVLRVGDDGYRLGQRLVRYGDAFVDDTSDLIALFYAGVADVHARLDETIQLGVYSEPDVTFVAFVDSSRPVRLATHVGRTIPAHASATGKAILAFSDESVVEALLAGPLAALTPTTIADAGAFRQELARIRERGWATESEESTRNLSCVAAPVLGANGRARAAVTICVPEATMSPERAAELASAAVSIAAHLGASMTGAVAADDDDREIA
jgi:DNA-binding IclR family transcriptional regulator